MSVKELRFDDCEQTTAKKCTKREVSLAEID